MLKESVDGAVGVIYKSQGSRSSEWRRWRCK